MPTPKPWTQSLSLDWNPQLSFYERKLDILRAFEDFGDLKSFQVREGSVAARLTDQNHQIDVRRTGLTLWMLSPQCDLERMRTAATTVVDTIKPPRARRGTGGFQYVLPVSATYDQARRNSAERLVGLPGDTEAIPLDWAVLLDGEFSGLHGGWQVEFGIVEAGEIPTRLSRQVGRMSDDARRIPPEHWEGVEFPEVALFADLKLPFDMPPDGEIAETFFGEWDRSLRQSASLIGYLQTATGLASSERSKVPEPAEGGDG